MRPRIPTAVKIARGTFRPDRAAANEPVATGKPSCPSWLKDADARREFRRLTKLLGGMGVVGSIDSNIMARYCVAWVRWRRVVQVLAKNPAAEFMTITDADGKPRMMQVSAVHSVERSLAETLGKMESALGMTPAARSRINVSLPTNTPEQPKSRFFPGADN